MKRREERGKRKKGKREGGRGREKRREERGKGQLEDERVMLSLPKICTHPSDCADCVGVHYLDSSLLHSFLFSCRGFHLLPTSRRAIREHTREGHEPESQSEEQVKLTWQID